MNYYTNLSTIILHVSGRDSRRYLNARLSNDIKIISPGQGCYAAALSPQGKTEGYFNISCISNEEFLVTCDGGDRETVVKAFKRYLVADRVVVKDLSDESRLTSLFPTPEGHALLSLLKVEALPGRICNHIKIGEAFLIKSKRAKTDSFDFIVPLDFHESIISALKNAGAKELSGNEFALLRIKSSTPSFPKELNEDVIFSASGLDYAVSFKKGCYVGQEVIEKIDAYGRVPYVLKALVVDGDASGQYEIKLENAAFSNDKVLSCYYDNTENKTYFFVELKNRDNILDSHFLINDNQAHILC